jgi:hypothetical protein
MHRLIVFALALSVSASAATFRAGAAKVDITPQDSQWLMGYQARQSTGVLDHIYHRVVALDDGTTQFYLISSDLCLFSPSVYDDFTAELHRQIGIDRGHVWWMVTHSHAAPEVGPPGIYKTLLGRSDHEWNRAYAQRIQETLIQGVKEARAKLEPARLAVGTGWAMANINRRARDANGRISLGLNPDGPADRQIGLLRFEKPDGSPIALIANYAMHGTAMSGKNLEISGDAPGVTAAYVEEKLGAPVLYMNSAAGNLAPIYSVYPDAKSAHLSEFQVLLGDHILQAVQQMGAGTPDVALAASEKWIETPRKPDLDWPEELGSYTAKRADGAPLVRLPVRFLRLNDTVLWSAPVEMFCEISMRVRNSSPFPHTFYFGYANGWIGYLPTRRGFEEGGYEPKTSVFTGQAEQDVGDAVIGHLQSMERRPTR